MKTEQKATWKNYVKNMLFIICMLCAVTLPQVIIWGWKNNNTEGLIFSLGILLIGITCLFIASHWHYQDIHITSGGFYLCMIIFVLSPFIIWWFKLYIWPNILISVYALGKPVLLWLKEKIDT